MIAYALFVLAWHGFAYLVAGWAGVGVALTLDVVIFLVLGVVFVLSIATREAQDRQSVSRIRARLFAHACPTCGELHGGYPWRQPR